ncbi:hypothetical protein PHLGIDRAFT_181774 [Phlebiopsis gigantea 11061_1 CR5-6]|uniref:F-box domain-containing protein n=1 Tax=Phlebiopsis gigantea (strain 11061_1 CR5-6) TaxID=745531 RepID=A0A0C3PG87_PHLG1|nr:hypothetical protein PHLGIDRAFT_181774 [Phlebiopsis gigantea 11061_1 CR5-6]
MSTGNAEGSPASGSFLAERVSRMDGRCPVPLRLNFDVLLVVLSLVEGRPNIGRMMRTCRTMHRAGVQHILYGNIRICDFEKFLSLCCFMLDKNPPRFRHLRHLDLDGWDATSATTSAILAVNDTILEFFQKAQYLEKLTLQFRDSDMLLGNTRIPQAISSLTNLVDFTMYGMGREGCTMLNKLQSPLTTISVCFDLYDMNPSDPGHIFRRFKDSLQELHIDWASLGTGDTTYPHLIFLRVDACVRADIGCMFRAYPNLQGLLLRMVDENEEADDSQDPSIELCRQANIAAQAAGTWETLRCLSGSLVGLYKLAARSKVQRLFLGLLRSSHLTRLQAVLTDSQPRALSFVIDAPQFDSVRLGEFLAPAVETLTALKLDVHNMIDWHYKHPSVTVTALLVSLSSFPIQFLSVTLFWGTVGSLTFYSSDPHQPDDACHPPFSALDVEALAQEAMRAIPSLRNLALYTVNPWRQWHWEIKSGAQGDGDGRIVIPLDQDEGERVLERFFPDSS